MIFLESEARVKISIERKDKEQNKRFYGLLYAQMEAVEEWFGRNLSGCV